MASIVHTSGTEQLHANRPVAGQRISPEKTT